MCQSCWKEKGSPKIDNEKVRAAVELIGNVYEYSGAGGGLHIVVDDFNIQDASVKSCMDHILQPDYAQDVGEDQFNAEYKCAEALLAMTEDERASALALHGGYFEKP